MSIEISVFIGSLPRRGGGLGRGWIVNHSAISDKTLSLYLSAVQDVQMPQGARMHKRGPHDGGENRKDTK
jgi:hypothetical protein